MARVGNKTKVGLWITGAAALAIAALAATMLTVLATNEAGRFEQEISAECAPLVVLAFRGSGEDNLTPGEYSNAGADYRYGETDMVTNGWEGITLTGLFDALAHSEHEGLRGDQIPVIPIGPAGATEPFGYDAIDAIVEAASIDSALTFSGSKLLYSATRGAEAATHLINEYLANSEGCPIAPKFVLAGYSQGAMAARHTAELNPGHVLGVIGIGDPYQKPGAPGVRAEGAQGNGIIRWKADAPQQELLDAYYGSLDLISSICHGGDPICEFSPIGGLFKLATGSYDDHMDYYSDAYPDEAVEDAEAILRLALMQWRLALAAIDEGQTVQWAECKPGDLELRSPSLSLAGTPTFFTAVAPGRLCADMTYEFDLDGDGVFETTSASGTVWTTFTDTGTHTVGLRVTNTATGESADTHQSVASVPADSSEINFDREGTLLDPPPAAEPAGTPDPDPSPAPDQEEPAPAPTQTPTPRPAPAPTSGPGPDSPPPTTTPPAPRPQPNPVPQPAPVPPPAPQPDPEFTLNTRHAFPGSTLRVHGASVPPGAAIDIFAVGSDLNAQASGVAASNGTLTVAVPMPSQGVVPGQYALNIEVNGDLVDTLTFSLWDPQVRLEGDPVEAGQSLVVSGEGFPPTTAVRVTSDFGFSSSWTTNSSGEITERQVPVAVDTAPGTYSLSFQPGTGTSVMTEVFEVFEPIKPPAFELEYPHAYPGSELRVTGSSVPPGSRVLAITDESDTRLFAQGEGFAGDDGTVTISVLMPNQGIFVDDYDLFIEVNGVVVDTLTFSLWNPTVQLTAYEALPGESVFASGQGFAPNTSMHMYDTYTQNSLHASTNAAGNFSNWEVQIPDNMAPGTYEIIFRVLNGPIAQTAFIEVLPPPGPVEPPEFSLTTPYAFPGSTVGVNGDLLLTGSEVVVRTQDPALVLEQSTIVGTGGWVYIPLPMPQQGIVPGEYELEVEVDGDVVDTLTLSLFDPTVTLETEPFYAGDTIEVTGEGFAANSDVYVVASFGYTQTWVTDGTGALTGESIPIPAAADPHGYTITFQMGQPGPVLTEHIEVLAEPAPTGPPEFVIDRQHAFPGDQLYVTGTSVPPGSLVQVQSTGSGLALQEQGVASGTGAVQIPLSIPNQGVTPGTYNLEVTIDGDPAETFTVSLWNPSVQVGAMLAGAGNGVVVSGTGFAPNTTVYVYDEWGAETALLTNGSGAFTQEEITLSVDVAPGTYQLEFHMGQPGPILYRTVNVMPNPQIFVNSVSINGQTRFEISPDQPVTITGSGFFSDSVVLIENYARGDEDTPAGQQQVLTGPSGQFSVGFSFSSSPAGDYRYDVTYDNADGISVTRTFTIVVVE